MSLNNLPSSLPLGEPAFCTSTGELFIGQGEGKPLIKVNGKELQNIRKDIETTSEQISEVNQQLDSKSDLNHIHSYNDLSDKPTNLATESYVNQEIEKTNTRIEELFQSVSNGKELLASALTDKGIPTLATESFEEIARKILSLDSGEVEELFNLITKNGDSLVTKNGDNLIYRGVM